MSQLEDATGSGAPQVAVLASGMAVALVSGMPRLTSALLASLLAAAAALVARPPQASACGGCLAPAEVNTAVESHRMVIALGRPTI